MILLGALASACSSGPAPQTTASAYLAAWSKQDWAGMRQLTDRPPADFVAVNSAAFTDLRVAQASFTAGTMKTTGSTAQAPVTERLALKGLGTVTLRPTLHLVQRSGHWLVAWTPATIAPSLGAGDRLARHDAFRAAAANAVLYACHLAGMPAVEKIAENAAVPA